MNSVFATDFQKLLFPFASFAPLREIFRFPFVIGFLFCFTGSLRATPPVAQFLDDKPLPGQLVGVGKDWQLTWQTADGKQKQSPAESLVSWGEWKEPGQGPLVVLSGGGWLVAKRKESDKELFTLDQEHLTLYSKLFGELKLPLELVAGFAPHPPSDQAERDALVRKILAATGKSDALWLENGDELVGKLTGLKANKLDVQAASGVVNVELAKVAAVVFNPALAANVRPKGVWAWAGFSDGSRVRLTQLLLDAKECRATLAGGLELKAELKSEPKPLVALQPIGGKAVYLSDLKADSYKHIPYLQLPWPYELDRNVLGGQLRCGGRTYLKGLGLHSAARLTYVLDQAYRRLDGEIGIDDATAGQGSVVFRVYTDDGSGTWKDRFTSPTVRGGQAPLPLSVDLAGVKRISLLVEFADHGDVQDHADWLNVRLVK